MENDWVMPCFRGTIPRPPALTYPELKIFKK